MKLIEASLILKKVLILTLVVGVAGCGKTKSRNKPIASKTNQTQTSPQNPPVTTSEIETQAKAEAEEKKRIEAAKVAEAAAAKKAEEEAAAKKRADEVAAAAAAQKAQADASAAAAAAARKAEADRATKAAQEEADRLAQVEKDKKKATKPEGNVETKVQDKSTADANAQNKEQSQENKADEKTLVEGTLLQGKLKVEKDEEKLVKNDVCSIGFKKTQSGALMLVPNMGGVEYPYVLHKNLLNQSTILNKDLLKQNDDKEIGYTTYSPAGYSTAKFHYQVEEGRDEYSSYGVSRKNLIIMDKTVAESRDEKVIASYLKENASKVFSDAKFEGILNTMDSFFVNLNKEGKIVSFTLSYQEVMNGSGRDQTHPLGDQNIRAIAVLHKNQFYATCEVEP